MPVPQPVYGRPLLLTPAQLAAMMPTPVVIDLRPAEQFAAGHLPGALHLDLWGLSLIDTSEAPLRAFMWMIGHLFSLRGVSPDRPVVVYEEDSGLRAARLFWFLEYLGHPSVRVLDGGIRAWVREGLPVSTDPVTPTAGSWHGELVPERVATWEDVRSRLGRQGVSIIDTRSEDEYRARIARAKRAGSIPGAVHLEWKQNLTPEGEYKSAADLQRMYASLGVTPD